MKNRVVLLILLASNAAMASEGDSLKIKPVRYFFTLTSNVLLCGSCQTDGGALALPTTIHGIRWKKLRVGAGVGYTALGPTRLMPYFGSVTFNLFGKKRQNGVFIEFNYGGAHAWLAPVRVNNDFIDDVKSWGFTQLSAGYAFHHHGLRLAVQTGVQSLKTQRIHSYGQGYDYRWGLMDDFVPPSQESFKYETTRAFVAISIGI